MTFQLPTGCSRHSDTSRFAVIRELRARVAYCMLSERRALGRRLRAMEKSLVSSPFCCAAVRRLAKRIDRAVQRAERRRRGLPVPTFPESLPITQARRLIADAFATSQVIIVCGQTASGKSTQLPKMCLSFQRGIYGLIGHTQPRRVAARSVSMRIADELKTPLGQAVGYQVRFSDRLSDKTYIKLMTDGILLAEVEADPRLERYDTIIIDEAHERTLNIDLLLGYLKRLLPKRPDLKLIISSATIDQERFSQYFDGAPLVEISGRGYPVEVRYRPLGVESGGDQRLAAAVSTIVQDVWEENQAPVLGDMLVFLPGERDIRESASILRKWLPSKVEVLPLYARMDTGRQDKIFASHAGRRIVLATNVAETSLTVPNIGYVIDSGLVRINRYSYRTKVQRLPIEPISQASAEQRKGRCGRVGPGVCIRLFSDKELASRPAFTEPEILRTDLGAVILKMKALGLGEMEGFAFLDRPDRRHLKDGYELLREVGALDETGELTSTGRRLARLPLHPRVGRILLDAAEEGCLKEALVVASFLSIDDPRERPLEAREAAIAAHAQFRHAHSDFLGSLALWRFYQEQKETASTRGLRAVCRQHYLSYARMSEWLDVHEQLVEITSDMGLPTSERPAGYSQLHRALLAGFLTRVGVRTEQKDYLGPRSMRFLISPASGTRRSGAKWVMAAELAETTRLYANQVARIRPEWIERAAQHLVKRHYREPHWEPRIQKVLAYEQVTFYGLTVIAGRRTDYGRIDPDLARELFIREALVAGRYDTPAAFFSHNRALLEELTTFEHKSRRVDLVEDDEFIFRFYEDRVPAGICTGQAFERWRAEAERRYPRLLFLTRQNLLRPAAYEVTDETFPDILELNGRRYVLEYRFQPGDPDDGITAVIPVASLMQQMPESFEWLVPGRLVEKIFFLIRSLPKDLRRVLGPASEAARIYAARLVPQSVSLTQALARAIRERIGVAIPAEAWNCERLPEYLLMNFHIVDLDGRVLDAGRDLGRLQRKLSSYARSQFRSFKRADFERTGISKWDFGDLPEQITWGAGAAVCWGYAALSDEFTTVALRAVASKQEAEKVHRAGLRRLFMLELAPTVRHLRRKLPGSRDMCLAYAAVPKSPFHVADHCNRGAASRSLCGSLQDDLLGLVVDRVFLNGEPMLRTETQFRHRQEEGVPRFTVVAQEVNDLVGEILQAYRGILGVRARIPAAGAAEALSDISTQLEYLIYQGFLREIDLGQLRHFPRYLSGLAIRLDRLRRDPRRDALKLKRMGFLWQRCRELLHQQALGLEDPELGKLRWMIEEFRVSLFAQELGTAYPISAKRLIEQWTRVTKSMGHAP
jgi:ATP-dependent helicase HrpA